jgi:hypothetical protein
MATPDIKGRRPLEDWQRLMEITSFYVGLSDDISYPEWRDFIVKVAGGEKFTPGDALSPDFHKKIEARLEELKPPVTALTRGEQVDIGKINFRIFGQRFTFDAWILSHLTAKAQRTRRLSPPPRRPSLSLRPWATPGPEVLCLPSSGRKCPAFRRPKWISLTPSFNG